MKEVELTVWGATGFTGRLVALYVAKTYPTLAKWAIAGRSESKLAALAKELESKHPTAAKPAVLVGDSKDFESVNAIAAKSKVVLACAGPFALYGSEMVRACARNGTHYLDLTGETYWHREMMEKYESDAKESGAIIIMHSGFDSIPSDLGCLTLVNHIRKQFKEDPKEIVCCAELAGGGSGGTFHSLIEAAQRMKTSDAHKRYGLVLNPPPELDSGLLKDELADHRKQLPRYNELAKTWTTAWAMYFVNSRVVYRSHALKYLQDKQGYGKDFQYTEVLKAPNVFAAVITFIIMYLILILGQFKFTRDLLFKILPKPGEGPSEELRSRSWFKVRFYGRTHSGNTAHLMISGGDAGYEETAKMIVESGMCLVQNQVDAKRLGGGFWTPATAFGEVLVGRLEKAGIPFEIKG